MSYEELVDLFYDMQDEMQVAQQEIEKFTNGNKSAGTRARKSMQNIKAAAQNMRVQIQAIKNG